LEDVSRGQVVPINNFYHLFKDILTPVQLDGLQFLLTPFPQDEFNPTDDRKSRDPSLGVARLDCHVNGHTTAQFHLNPDARPQERPFPLDTVILRGMFTTKFTARSEVSGLLRTVLNLNSELRISTARRYTPRRRE